MINKTFFSLIRKFEIYINGMKININSNNKKLYFKIALWALLIELGAAPLRAISFKLCAVVTFVLFFVFQFLILQRYQKRLKAEYVLLFSLIGGSLLQIVGRILQPNSLISLPDFLFHLMGIVMGYLFYKSSRISRILILAFSLSSCSFLYFKGYNMWINYLSYDTFTGKIDDNKEYNLKIQTNTSDTLSLSDFRGKYLLLDCWCTSCGFCYKAMPSHVRKILVNGGKRAGDFS